MTTHYKEASDLQDEAEISFHQKSVHFNSSNSSLSPTPGMPTFNDDLNQSIYYTAGNLMNLMQMILQNQMTAAEITQHLTTSVSAQRDTMRDKLQKYQKKVKYALDIKSVTTFDDSNYEAWCVDMLTDVKVIDEINILLRTQ
ncbi:hypothetical protein BDDG_12898 [Blastomyces dermatitidis ATCC 18188]|uniref:Uncharacterized protein n=1 Tax=Ajellomyces dermatitidis (strain ATCC 18188 / CBS 674.68) TaxID=653446 RepID=A0A0J9EQN2_AJEDA|nr:hypothetical protein BDDG_12898 [Blastomyces dermatitidis ATCC 18188]